MPNADKDQISFALSNARSSQMLDSRKFQFSQNNGASLSKQLWLSQSTTHYKKYLQLQKKYEQTSS